MSDQKIVGANGLDRVLIIECRYGNGYFANYVRDQENDFTVIDLGVTGGDYHWERFQLFESLDCIPIAHGETRALALQNLETKCADFTMGHFYTYQRLLDLWDHTADKLKHKTPEERKAYFDACRNDW